MHRYGTVHVIVLQECGRQLAPRLCRFDAQRSSPDRFWFYGSETGPNKNDPKIPDGQRIADIEPAPQQRVDKWGRRALDSWQVAYGMPL
jgi:hypothetical protein